MRLFPVGVEAFQVRIPLTCLRPLESSSDFIASRYNSDGISPDFYSFFTCLPTSSKCPAADASQVQFSIRAPMGNQTGL